MAILEADLAQKYIDKVAQNLEYNLNIMNDEGIIIASKIPSRIGDFHEVAHGMLTGKINSGIVNNADKFIGTKPGINMFIDYKDKHVGVICVSGDPDTVHTFAGIVKTSMETMLEYELQKDKKRNFSNISDKFIYYLLFEENTDFHIAQNMANELNLNNNLRTFIIIKILNKIPAINLSKTIQKINEYQDIFTIGRNNEIIILKSFEGPIDDILRNYKEYSLNYINKFLYETKSSTDDDFAFYIGSLQNELIQYKNSYTHAQSIILSNSTKDKINFFNDNILNYFRVLINNKVYSDIFSVYETLLSDNDKIWLVNTVDSLIHNNYNIVNSAKELYIHRNTLLFRINKIKDILNIDPINNSNDRTFFNEFAYYIKSKL